LLAPTTSVPRLFTVPIRSSAASLLASTVPIVVMALVPSSVPVLSNATAATPPPVLPKVPPTMSSPV
jgi:hypothetical protein